MSDPLLTAAGFTVSSYSGPQRPDGGLRKRYQLTVTDAPEHDGARVITLSAEQWAQLGLLHAGMDPDPGFDPASLGVQPPRRTKGG